MKRIFLYVFISLLTLLFVGINLYFGIFKKENQDLPQSVEVSQESPLPTMETKTIEKPQQELETKKAEVPAEYDLKVPFVSQAPFGVWDQLHDNACEEASLLLVHYFKQKKALSREQADKEIREMVDLQIKKYGQHKDLTALETADLAKEFYGYKNVRVKYNFTWNELKQEIANGNPVIVPAAGRLLKNPNFRQPGPIYHMFVIRGYTPIEIITNDVGTRKGEGYRYSYSILDNALHDWTGSPESITKGQRVMIILAN